MRKYWKLLAVGVPLFLIGGFIYLVFFTEENIIEVKKGNLTEDILASGDVVASNEIELGFLDGGRVYDINVKPGSKVQEGDILVSLDSRELEAELKSLEAKTILSKAKLSQLLAGVRSEELNLFEAHIESAKIDLDNSLKNFENIKIKSDNDITQRYQAALDIADSVLLTASNSIDTLNLIYQPSNQFKTFFFVSDSNKKSDAEWQIIFTREAFESIKSDVASVKLDSSNKNIDEILPKFKVNMEIMRLSLSKTYDALNTAIVVSDQKNINDFIADIARTRAGINSTQTDLLNKEQAISEQKIVNQKNISEAENLVKSKKSILEEKEEELVFKKAKPRSVEIAVYEAEIKEVEASRLLIREKIANMHIVSPISGMIKNIHTKTGSLIGVKDRVISMISISDFQIESEISLENGKKIRVGDKVDISLNYDDKKRALRGSVISMNLKEDERPKIYIAFLDEVENLEFGIKADLNIKAVIKRNALLISKKAIIKDEIGESVILFEDGKKSKISVVTGAESKDEIEILSGIYEGDMIISQ